jgi:hypothetical protein
LYFDYLDALVAFCDAKGLAFETIDRLLDKFGQEKEREALTAFWRILAWDRRSASNAAFVDMQCRFPVVLTLA